MMHKNLEGHFSVKLMNPSDINKQKMINIKDVTGMKHCVNASGITAISDTRRFTLETELKVVNLSFPGMSNGIDTFMFHSSDIDKSLDEAIYERRTLGNYDLTKFYKWHDVEDALAKLSTDIGSWTADVMRRVFIKEIKVVYTRGNDTIPAEKLLEKIAEAIYANFNNNDKDYTSSYEKIDTCINVFIKKYKLTIMVSSGIQYYIDAKTKLNHLNNNNEYSVESNESMNNKDIFEKLVEAKIEEIRLASKLLVGESELSSDVEYKTYIMKCLLSK